MIAYLIEGGGALAEGEQKKRGGIVGALQGLHLTTNVDVESNGLEQSHGLSMEAASDF